METVWQTVWPLQLDDINRNTHTNTHSLMTEQRGQCDRKWHVDLVLRAIMFLLFRGRGEGRSAATAECSFKGTKMYVDLCVALPPGAEDGGSLGLVQPSRDTVPVSGAHSFQAHRRSSPTVYWSNCGCRCWVLLKLVDPVHIWPSSTRVLESSVLKYLK